MKIPKKYATLVFVFLVALTMSCLMSFMLTAINLGFPAEFFSRWMRSFAIAFPVAFVVALLVVPQSQAGRKNHGLGAEIKNSTK